MIESYLRDYQLEAVKHMHNGCILDGGVGSGKSRTSLAYYMLMGRRHADSMSTIKAHRAGDFSDFDGYRLPDVYANPTGELRRLYIITTARKRDTEEWEGEVDVWLDELVPNDWDGTSETQADRLVDTMVIDSWNNIQKYKDVTNAFFIFDEQRAVGTGKWAKAFMRIARSNDWIMLSATPGDTWIEYMPVFIANGFYDTMTSFKTEHVVYDNYVDYPKIRCYMNTRRLEACRDALLVNMEYYRPAITTHADVFVEYDKAAYKDITKTRWNSEEERPIRNASEYCMLLRKLVGTAPERAKMCLEIMQDVQTAIIFYQYNFERDVLLETFKGWPLAEWNGHKHEPVPTGDEWVYLVQYTAGAEGWNCITTPNMIFYSNSYSYKIMTQAAGRIDRMNTPFNMLRYYHLRSRAPIDNAVAKALETKKLFNENAFTKGMNFERS